MMNKIRQIFSHKLRLSGIRGCMAAGAMTAGIAALAVIGGVNSEDISTVSLETDVIPEETVTEAVIEKKTYSHDMEYFSPEDMKKMTSKEEETEARKDTANVNEAVNEPSEISEPEEETTENNTSEDTEDTVPEENESITAYEEPSDEEDTSSEETVSYEEEAPETDEDETVFDDEPSEDVGENAEEYNEPEQSEENTDTEDEQETSESVYARTSAAGGDEDNGGLSSALDLETEDSTEGEAVSEIEIVRFNSAAPAEAPSIEEAPVDMEDNGIPEDITLDDEEETEPEETAAAPQENAISLFDLPEWLTFDENGIPTEYVNVLTGNACAYTAAPDALMSTGKEVFQGYVAVDPDIIPYGTELYIVAEDGEVYGYAIAADTGYSVRKGDIIVDLFMNEYDDCIQWGNKPVYVYVLK